MKNLVQRAKEEAEAMYNQGLEPWHIKDRIASDVPPMYREEFNALVKKALEERKLMLSRK